MTLRSLASSLGIAAVLCLAPTARAQDPAPPQPKAKAADEAKKAEGTDTTKSETPKAEAAKDEKAGPKMEKAVFAGGCFWCLEAFFERVKGVTNVVSGYTGGSTSKPSYEVVCTGLTGHAEAVAIDFDANVISYDELLDIFWLCHDPTTLNRQGPDEGTQYRSAIFYLNDEQKKVIDKSYQKVVASGYYRDPIVTQVVPFVRFWPAESYHQNYFRKNANKNPYCQTVIIPKLNELRAKLNYKAQQEALQKKK